MQLHYNLISGRSLERLAALSDGIFAVAMTLLVLDLRVPMTEITASQQPLWVNGALQSERAFLDVLAALIPRLIPYLMSFMTLGIFWLAQQTQLNQMRESDRNLAWINLGYLLGVSLMPFSTGLLSEYINFRVALIIYWLNLLILGVMLYRSIVYAQKNKLVKEDVTVDMINVHKRRIVIYQLMYAFGALLCIFSTGISIAFIVLVQLNSMLAPRIRGLYKI